MAAPRAAILLLPAQNAGGEQYLANSTRMDLEFLAVPAPQKRGMGNQPSAWHFWRPAKRVLRAWAMGFRWLVCDQLPGDQEFLAISNRTALLQGWRRQKGTPPSFDFRATTPH
jgi:hypothetical protein